MASCRDIQAAKMPHPGYGMASVYGRNALSSGGCLYIYLSVAQASGITCKGSCSALQTCIGQWRRLLLSWHCPAWFD